MSIYVRTEVLGDLTTLNARLAECPDEDVLTQALQETCLLAHGHAKNEEDCTFYRDKLVEKLAEALLSDPDASFAHPAARICALWTLRHVEPVQEDPFVEEDPFEAEIAALEKRVEAMEAFAEERKEVCDAFKKEREEEEALTAHLETLEKEAAALFDTKLEHAQALYDEIDRKSDDVEARQKMLQEGVERLEKEYDELIQKATKLEEKYTKQRQFLRVAFMVFNAASGVFTGGLTWGQAFIGEMKHLGVDLAAKQVIRDPMARSFVSALGHGSLDAKSLGMSRKEALFRSGVTGTVSNITSVTNMGPAGAAINGAVGATIMTQTPTVKGAAINSALGVASSATTKGTGVDVSATYTPKGLKLNVQA